jgi:hypothetical protein
MPMLEGFLETWSVLGSGELDGDQMTQGDTGFIQARPPCRVKTYVLLV